MRMRSQIRPANMKIGSQKSFASSIASFILFLSVGLGWFTVVVCAGPGWGFIASAGAKLASQPSRATARAPRTIARASQARMRRRWVWLGVIDHLFANNRRTNYEPFRPILIFQRMVLATIRFA